jgi:acetolactate synthase I/II/III large subunit
VKGKPWDRPQARDGSNSGGHTIKVADAIARALKDECVELLICYPRNLLIDRCVESGLRPIVCRQERVGAGIADGISRSTNGKKIGVFAPQGGPGIENSFSGVAQSFSDGIPLLVLPGPAPMGRSHTRPTFSAVDNFEHITKWGCELDDPARVWELMRRAFHNLRSGRTGPVLIEMIGDVTEAECGEYAYRPVRIVRSAPDPADVRLAADVLLAAKRPVIQAGQGILFSGATAELIRVAELLHAPVLTTNPGKSSFPEDHPLALGAMVNSAPKPAFAFLKDADCVFGAGTSFSRVNWAPKIQPGKKMVHLTNDPGDINKDYFLDAAILADAKLGLQALAEEIVARKHAPTRDAAAEVAAVRRAWEEEWAPERESSEKPINQYRVIRDLQALLAGRRTIVTHEAGSPREQMIPFWQSRSPRDYLGWGKSTSLGSGLGMIMGAKLANPDAVCVNVMGDASIGMVGMDIETAVRNRIGIITVVFNNGIMAGERLGMEHAIERYNAIDLGGDYRAVAAGLGAWSKRVEIVDDFVPAAQEALDVSAAGRPALIEVMAKECTHFSRY